jgi:hypothetical protein
LPRTRLAALLVAAAVLVGAPAQAETPSPPAGVGECAPGLGIGLLEVPKATLEDPRARNYIVDSVKPGATFTRKFQVCNGTSSPLPVQLYPDAASIVDGAFVLDDGRGQSELTSWMSVDPPSLTIAPGKAVAATVRFTVPDDATQGERYGGIVAEAPPQGDTISVGGRVGIRVYLNVSTGGAPKSDFTIDSLQAVRASDGTPAVLARVHNTGARALDMRGSLSLSEGPGGLAAGPFDAKLGTTLAPGDTAPVVVPLDKAISGGPWKAVISMKSGLLERRAEGQITFPDEPDTTSPAVVATSLPLYKDKGVVFPFAIGVVGVVALLLLLTLWWLWRQRRRKDDERSSQEVVG